MKTVNKIKKCYFLRILENSTIYKEIDKFNKLADEMNLICTYNLNSKDDAQNLRMKYIEEVTPLKANREKLRQSYKKATNEADKTIIQSKIDIITEDINKINSKIQTCKRIITKAEKDEKENYLIKKRQDDNKLKKDNQISIHKKVRVRY